MGGGSTEKPCCEREGEEEGKKTNKVGGTRGEKVYGAKKVQKGQPFRDSSEVYY